MVLRVWSICFVGGVTRVLPGSYPVLPGSYPAVTRCVSGVRGLNYPVVTWLQVLPGALPGVAR